MEQVADQLRRVLRAQRRERHLHQAMGEVPLGMEAQVPGAPFGIGTRGDQDHERQMIGQFGQENEKLNGRRIGPVEVLDGEDGWTLGGESLEQRSKREDELGLEGLRIRLALSLPARLELDAKEMRDRRLDFLVSVAN